jgi:hypothetical protein
MAGHGSGAGRAGGSGQDAPAHSAAPADVPAQTLRSWDAAEAGLFPLIMARPHEYERSVSLVQILLGWLRDNCADIPALLAESARGEALVAGAVGGRPGHPRQTRPGSGADGGPDHGGPNHGSADQPDLAGLRLDLIAAAACAMRYRELMAARAASRRLDAFASAREGGESWAVIEEAGDEARAPFLPYQRVEAHVPSGRALIISIEPDETLSAVWRIDQASLDMASGGLVIGAEIGSYVGVQEFDIALASARLRLS